MERARKVERPHVKVDFFKAQPSECSRSELFILLVQQNLEKPW